MSVESLFSFLLNYSEDSGVIDYIKTENESEII